MKNTRLKNTRIILFAKIIFRGYGYKEEN